MRIYQISKTLAIEVMAGYLYCFSNPSIPGLLKVGGTLSSPTVKAKELFTTAVPTPFKIEFAKKVTNVKQKEKDLRLLLTKYIKVCQGRDYYETNPEVVREFFNIIDGEMLGEFVYKEVPPSLLIVRELDGRVIESQALYIEREQVAIPAPPPNTISHPSKHWIARTIERFDKEFTF
jgi:hypothetical protein